MAVMNIGEGTFEWGARTYVMGILNITPDSFSGDGLLSSSGTPAGEPVGIERALEQAGRFLAAGADILDVGGESTRPGSQTVSVDEELERVVPVIAALARQFPQAVISVDTYKAAVASESLSAGAHIVNDVWGLRADPMLAEVVASHRVPIILMHNRSKPTNAQVQANLGGRYVGMQYDNLLEDVKNELLESVTLARQAGIAQDKIILDPGIGFGKTVEQNLELLNRLGEVRLLGYPILLGPSRKSFIGYSLNLPPDQRLEGTAAAVSVGIVRGADIIRVHDVEMMVRIARMTDAIVRFKH
jgi:dihydropteroate synthase